MATTASVTSISLSNSIQSMRSNKRRITTNFVITINPITNFVITINPITNFTTRNICLNPSSFNVATQMFLKQYPFGFSNRNCYGLNRIAVKPVSPVVMQWQDCSVKMEIDVPISVAYNCYSDRESIPRWMPFISSVKILEDKPDLSRWALKYEAFGQNIEFSWVARNMQPIVNQKIHWRSLEGLPNRGAVRFFPKGPSSCVVDLTVSYEVPAILTPVASALKPFLETLLLRGLKRFATYAREESAKAEL